MAPGTLSTIRKLSRHVIDVLIALHSPDGIVETECSGGL